jgi:O-6-methylguanine DNA methyltransferase
VRVEQTRYAVPRWGMGELWTADGVVLAHDFAFGAVSDTGASAERDASPTNASISGRRVSAPGAERPVCGAIETDLASAPLDTNQCLTPKELAPKELVERFAAFFRGENVHFGDVELDLSWATSFQRAVADTLRRVPRGEVVSYGELAALVGHPGAQRAVGTFCARNRFMLLVPCHRVVGAEGIGGYGSAGIAAKRRLLALEGVTV